MSVASQTIPSFTLTISTSLIRGASLGSLVPKNTTWFPYHTLVPAAITLARTFNLRRLGIGERRAEIWSWQKDISIPLGTAPSLKSNLLESGAPHPHFQWKNVEMFVFSASQCKDSFGAQKGSKKRPAKNKTTLSLTKMLTSLRLLCRIKRRTSVLILKTSSVVWLSLCSSAQRCEKLCLTAQNTKNTEDSPKLLKLINEILMFLWVV